VLARVIGSSYQRVVATGFATFMPWMK